MTDKENKEAVKVELETEVKEVSEKKEVVSKEKQTESTETKTYNQDSRRPYRDNRDSRDNKREYKRDSRDNRGSGDRDDYKFRKMRRKVCLLCKERNYVLDYKDAETVKRFINEKGKILPRRATGTCAKHQREIAQVIKRARHIAVLPFTID